VQGLLCTLGVDKEVSPDDLQALLQGTLQTHRLLEGKGVSSLSLADVSRRAMYAFENLNNLSKNKIL